MPMSHSHQRQSVLIAAATILVVLAGCSRNEHAPMPAGSETTSQPQAPTASASFQGLRAFDVVSGKVPIKVTAADGRSKLDLVIDGKVVASREKAPYEFSLDTSRMTDGLAKIALSSGQGILAELPLVVVNQGSEVFFKNGSGGKVTVPPTGYQHQHLRYHWDNKDGVKKILTILQWDKQGFDLELALGQGTCPHHGTKVADRRSTSSPIALVYEPPPDKPISSGQWFAHVRLMNPDQVVGQETSFSIKAFLFR